MEGKVKVRCYSFHCLVKLGNNTMCAALTSTKAQATGLTKQVAIGAIDSSRHATLPPIKSTTIRHQGEDKNRKGVKLLTPFSLPPGDEVFTIRETERLKALADWANERCLKVHEKGTYSSRLSSMLADLRKQVLNSDKSQISKGHSDGDTIQEDTDFVLTTTRDRHLEREDLNSYINRKREMFLVQYALGVKKEEISKLISISEAEEKKLEAAEQYIELSATVFDEFLKENDKAAVEAIKKAELATKAKLDKMAEIKRLNAHLVAIKNEMSRNNDFVSELRTYKNFLDRLTTDEIKEQWRACREKSKVVVKKKKRKEELTEDGSGECEEGGGGGGETVVNEEEQEKEEEKAALYFSDPVQMLNIFTELEEQNLSLIQNSQETEITLEELRQNRQAVEKTMHKEVTSLRRHIELMKLNIAHEEEKSYHLEIKSKLYSYGEYKSEDQEKMLLQLDKKVTDVYTKCIGANEANLSALQMLAAIENRLEELFETMESLPAEKIEAAEKAKEKERRLRKREEKMEEQRHAQEERLRRALERAQADPKKRVGRKLVYRSEPPVLKRKHITKDEKKEKEEEELQYFFS